MKKLTLLPEWRLAYGDDMVIEWGMYHHTVVWVDHHEAKLFEFEGDGVHREVVKAHPHGHGRRTETTKHAEGDAKFFASIADVLAQSARILIVGPGAAKLELSRYLHKHAPKVETNIVGIETVDHPTDNQVVAYARHYFKASDHMK